MPVQLLAVTFDSPDPPRQGQFWGAVLDREAVEHAGGVLLAGHGSKLGLRFVQSAAVKVRPNLGHFHLTSATAADQQSTVSKLLDLGGSHIAFGQTPEDDHIVMADPDGNELCVMEPNNNFLAGCGFFGELACDGSRDVGLFWTEVLGWPLVWDLVEETAIQSPDGGTKISWGGEPAAPPEVARRLRFYLLAPDDLDTEVDRLIALGATELTRQDNGTVTLTDPDANPFEVAAM